MGVKIIVDSTTDLAPGIRQQLTVVPLTVHFGDAEYLDGITLSHRGFYEKLIESDVLPTTSQATPGAFADVFAQVVAAGDTAVVLTIAAELSGTWQSAMIAAEDYQERIFVVDTRTAAIGGGILAELALELADRGMDAKSIAREITCQREKVHVVALLDTLEYLKRGGRISKTAALAGSMLAIKPVVSLRHGQILTLGKARGSRQGNNLLVSEIAKAGGVDFDKPVLLGYTGLDDTLLQKYIADSEALWSTSGKPLRTTIIGSVIGTHAGPGAIAVAFFQNTAKD